MTPQELSWTLRSARELEKEHGIRILAMGTTSRVTGDRVIEALHVSPDIQYQLARGVRKAAHRQRGGQYAPVLKIVSRDIRSIALSTVNRIDGATPYDLFFSGEIDGIPESVAVAEIRRWLSDVISDSATPADRVAALSWRRSTTRQSGVGSSEFYAEDAEKLKISAFAELVERLGRFPTQAEFSQEFVNAPELRALGTGVGGVPRDRIGTDANHRLRQRIVNAPTWIAESPGQVEIGPAAFDRFIRLLDAARVEPSILPNARSAIARHPVVVRSGLPTEHPDDTFALG